MAKRKRSNINGRKIKTKKGSSNLSFWKLAFMAIAIIISIFVAYAFSNGNISFSLEDIFTTKSESIEYEPEKLLSIHSNQERDEVYIKYKGFSVSFNPTYRIPNYVVYELTQKETEGAEKRANSFECDRNIPNCPTPQDYTHSGFDRGHMAPAADMKWDSEAMHESFFMTNICPQKHSLNGRGWKSLEEKLRDWVQRDSSLIIVTGPIMSDSMKVIGNTGIAIPTQFFKAVLAPKANPLRAIAFIYRNEGGQKNIEDQVTSVDEVEKATGLDFFHILPDDIENRIEQSTDYREWNN